MTIHPLKLVVLTLLLSTSGYSMAMGDQWYIGIGGGGSRLQPDPDVAGITRKEEAGQHITVFIGRDFDRSSSGQLQLYSLGEAVFNNDEPVTYNAIEASLLYRFYDSRDSNRRAVFGASFYGRFGFGALNRDTTIEIENAPPVYFGAGAGIEMYVTDAIALRLEAQYHDEDAVSANLALVTRLGGRSGRSAQPGYIPRQNPDERQSTPPTAPSYGNQPSVPNQEPDTTSTAKNLDSLGVDDLPAVELMTSPSTGNPTNQQRTDRDNDGVVDSADQCLDSEPNSFVDNTGCSVVSQLAKQLRFPSGSAKLTQNANNALKQIASLLLSNPAKRLEIIAHTDTSGTEQSQSQLTRQRLRAIGLYLVGRGIAQERLLLRSFAATKPAFSNSTAAGRAANNRVEIRENF